MAQSVTPILFIGFVSDALLYPFLSLARFLTSLLRHHHDPVLRLSVQALHGERRMG